MLIELKTAEDVTDIVTRDEGVKIYHVRIYPEAAQAFLDLNNRNRTLKSSHIALLASFIGTPRWKLTNNGIAVDTEGNVFDGQHRLHAVIRAGAPAEFSLHVGLAPDTREVIDVGMRRSSSDALTMEGYAEFGGGTKNLAAVLTLLYRYDKHALKLSGSPLPGAMQHDVLLAYAERFDMDKMQQAVSDAHTINRSMRGFNRSALSAVLYLAITCDPYIAAEFTQRLHTGENLVRGDPELALRNLITNLLTARRNDWHFCVYVKAWNARRSGKRVMQLGFREDETPPIFDCRSNPAQDSNSGITLRFQGGEVHYDGD